jgi:hypothetical protein
VLFYFILRTLPISRANTDVQLKMTGSLKVNIICSHNTFLILGITVLSSRSSKEYCDPLFNLSVPYIDLFKSNNALPQVWDASDTRMFLQREGEELQLCVIVRNELHRYTSYDIGEHFVQDPSYATVLTIHPIHVLSK